MSCPLVQYQAYNHLALWLGDYKPDIALVAWHNINRYTYILYIYMWLYIIIIYMYILWNMWYKYPVKYMGNTKLRYNTCCWHRLQGNNAHFLQSEDRMVGGSNWRLQKLTITHLPMLYQIYNHFTLRPMIINLKQHL